MKKSFATPLASVFATALLTLSVWSTPAFADAAASASAPVVAVPAATAPTATAPSATAPSPAPPAFPWLYIVGGVLAVGAGAFVYRTAKRRAPPSTPQRPAAAPRAAAPPAPVLVNFDAKDFLRQAKASFIRMQAAWDKADTADLSKFTTPQVLAELKAQIGARAPDPNVTEVIAINAELLGVETIGDDYVASVSFNGDIKPAGADAVERFAEVWNMTRAITANTGWKLSGIQQLS